MCLVIGIDGGGTKTDAVLCDNRGNVLNRVILGASNPIDIGIEKCIDVLCDAVAQLGVDGTKQCSLFAGIAGGMSGNNKRLIHEGLKQKLPETVLIDNHSDAVCALNSGVGMEDGGVVISGTGCVGYLRKKDEIYRIGGYGYLLDRGGSGYDFGRDALYYAYCDADGRGEKTVLTGLLEEKTGGLIKNLDVIYQKGKPYIASLAPLVFEAYRRGDAVAENIVERNAEEYAKILNRMAELLSKDECKIVLAGGMWKESDIILKHTRKYLRHDMKFIIPVVLPVYGALIQAAQNVGVLETEFTNYLKKDLMKSGD